ELRGSKDELLRVAQQFGLEGLVAKRPNSVYESGRRSGVWVKFKITKSQEFVIAATHCQKAAGAIWISSSFLLYPLRIIGVPGQSRPGPDLDQRFLERFRAFLHETVFYRISAAGDPSLNRFPSRI